MPQVCTNNVEYLNLSDALFTTTQQWVLALLFGRPECSLFSNQLIALTGSGSGAVQRELRRLTDSGLIKSKRIGNQRHFQANPAAPIFNEILALVQKTFGVAEPIRKALMPYEEAIHCAFIFGSVAKHKDTAESDIDLFLVSDILTSADLVNQLLETEVKLFRRINTIIYSKRDLARGLLEENPFQTRNTLVHASSRLVSLVGHARDYVEMQWLMLQQDQPEDFVIATGVQYSRARFCNAAAKELDMGIRWEGEGADEKGYLVNGSSRCARDDENTPSSRGAVGPAADRPIVKVDPRYFRPTEVETLLGDPTKAKEKLGWTPRTSFEELVAEMVREDLKSAERDELIKNHGYRAIDYHE